MISLFYYAFITSHLVEFYESFTITFYYHNIQVFSEDSYISHKIYVHRKWINRP